MFIAGTSAILIAVFVTLYANLLGAARIHKVEQLTLDVPGEKKRVCVCILVLLSPTSFIFFTVGVEGVHQYHKCTFSPGVDRYLIPLSVNKIRHSDKTPSPELFLQHYVIGLPGQEYFLNKAFSNPSMCAWPGLPSYTRSVQP